MSHWRFVKPNSNPISNKNSCKIPTNCFFYWFSQNLKKLFFFLKKETLVFSCEFCEISKNIFFTEHLWTTASEKCFQLLTLSKCFTSLAVIKGSTQCAQKVTFEPLMVFKKTVMEVGNITKAATFKSFLRSLKLLKHTITFLVTVFFDIFIRQSLTDDFWCYTNIWIARFL